MTKVRDVIEVLERWAPSSLAEKWDNVGLIRIIYTAIKEDICIFASHTNLDQATGGVSFSLSEKLGLESITFLAPGNNDFVKFVTFTPPDYTDRIREAAGSAGAGIIGEYNLCSFTSKGMGTYIPSCTSAPYEGKPGELSRVEEERLEMIVPNTRVSQVVEETRKVHPYEEMAYDIIPLSNPDISFGYGAVGNLKEPKKPQDFLEHIATSLGVKNLRVSKSSVSHINRVAVMGGSGKNLIHNAIESGADAYITGDLGYHDFTDYGESILLIDASHQATELPVLEKIKARIISSDLDKKIELIVAYEDIINASYDFF